MHFYDLAVLFSESNEQYDAEEGPPRQLIMQFRGYFVEMSRRPSFEYLDELVACNLITKKLINKAINSYRSQDISNVHVERFYHPDRAAIKGTVHASESIKKKYSASFNWNEDGITGPECDCKGSGICSHVLAIYLVCSSFVNWHGMRPSWAVIHSYRNYDTVGPCFNTRYAHDILVRKASMDLDNYDYFVTVEKIPKKIRAPHSSDPILPSSTVNESLHSVIPTQNRSEQEESALLTSSAAYLSPGPSSNLNAQPTASRKKKTTSEIDRPKKVQKTTPKKTKAEVSPVVEDLSSRSETPLPSSKRVDVVEILDTKRVRKAPNKNL